MSSSVIELVNRVTCHWRRCSGESERAASSSIYLSIADAAKREGEHIGLPEFTGQGHLPAGLHRSDASAFLEKFGRGDRRQKLLEGLLQLVEILRHCGCKRIVIGGSFVTSRESPGDFEGVFQMEGMDLDKLERLEPSLLARRSQDPERLDALYGGCLSPWYRHAVGGPGLLEYLQYDDRNGCRKGVVVIEL